MAASSRVLIAAVVVLGLAGCAQADPDRTSAEPRYLGADEYAAALAGQRELLADGTVSKPDYETAAQRFSECLTKHGLEVRNLGWDPLSGQQIRHQFRSSAMPQETVDGYGQECLTAHLAEVSEQYTESTTPAVAVDLLDFTRRCLTEKGVTTSGQEKTLQALRESAGDKEQAVSDCATTGMTQLYPDMPVVMDSPG